MRKTIIYVLPVDKYWKHDERNLSTETLNELDGVDRYTLDEFIEACNDEKINLVNCWIAYRQVDSEND